MTKGKNGAGPVMYVMVKINLFKIGSWEMPNEVQLLGQPQR